MTNNVLETVQTVSRLSFAEQREIIARIWAEQTRHETGKTWKSIKFSEKMHVTAYSEEQEIYVEDLRQTLREGTLARVENETDGTFEIYGTERTFYVTMTIEREFVGLLSSWKAEKPPIEINLDTQN